MRSVPPSSLQSPDRCDVRDDVGRDREPAPADALVVVDLQVAEWALGDEFDLVARAADVDVIAPVAPPTR